MTDEVDYAQQLEQERLDALLQAERERIDSEKKRLLDAQESGVNLCRYCGEPVEGYTSAFCPPDDYGSCRV